MTKNDRNGELKIEASAALSANRDNWDKLTEVHRYSSFYDVDSFLNGRSTLCKPELELVGDVNGKLLLHLQCHFGLDTLSWERLGARVTGVDFSPTAVEQAYTLARSIGSGAKFICSDVMQLPEDLGTYDIVVTTYGVLCWLCSLSDWAQGIARSLHVGGRFIVVDFHPILEPLHPNKMTGAGAYFYRAEPSVVTTKGTYADPNADLVYDEYRWQHNLGSVVSALIQADLQVTDLTEYPYCSYGLFDCLTQGCDGLWWNEDSPYKLPYMFSVTAQKT